MSRSFHANHSFFFESIAKLILFHTLHILNFIVFTVCVYFRVDCYKKKPWQKNGILPTFLFVIAIFEAASVIFSIKNHTKLWSRYSSFCLYTSIDVIHICAKLYTNTPWHTHLCSPFFSLWFHVMCCVCTWKLWFTIVASNMRLCDGKVSPNTYFGYFFGYTLLQWQKSHALSFDLKEFKKMKRKTRKNNTHKRTLTEQKLKRNTKKTSPGFILFFLFFVGYNSVCFSTF